jgi:acyl-CoA synthetase (AMP-forming)/AMP-acid ligase II
MSSLRTLTEALADAARRDAGYCFVTPEGEARRSYAEIRTASLRVARALNDAGLRRGDLVALVLPDGEQFLTALFGASIAGVIPASLHPPATTTDLPRYIELTAGILNAAVARAVITSRALAPGFVGARAMCPHLSLVLAREELDAPASEPDAAPTLDDIAFVQYTSGSTAAPKGIALTHASVSTNIEAFIERCGVGSGSTDVAVSWLPLNHDMGLVGMGLGALYCGRPCVLLTPQSFVKRPSDWLRAITRHGGTISFAPNFAYDLCVRRVKDLAGLDLSGWRVAGCGAEPIHPATLAAFADKFAEVGFDAASFLPSYGLAEHVLAATFAPRGRAPRVERVSSTDLAERRMAVPAAGDQPVASLVSCGVALPDHRIRIADADGEPLPERSVGEILLSGPSVMRGYYKQDELTAEAVRDGWLRTGDLGYLSDGELFVCGRVKDLIIVNGRNYHPQDFEWAVDDVSGVRRGRVVAFGVAERGRADRVVIVVEPTGTVTSDQLTAAIRKRIGDLFGLYVDDVAIVPGGTVGRTTSGKVQRAATKERYLRAELSADGIRA